MNLKLYNSLTRHVDTFKPLKKNAVGFYACGPTVYQYAHIGNLRTYLFEDILRRTLKSSALRVKHIMNITDVGHLTSDADIGEDKIEKEAKRQKISARKLARLYEKAFKNDLKLLNITPPTKWVRATEHIQEQINLIKKLEKKGFIYITTDGVYFNTSAFKNYGIFPQTYISGLKAGARVTLGQKKNFTDFALWKFSPQSASRRRQMEWKSPWGVGFPGWHIECSAMSMKYLGNTFDIHAGGIDHLPIHHTNEAAQSQAVTGKLLANFWTHGEFLIIDKKRMGKSEGNFITLEDIIKKGFYPLDFRYLTFLTHYRSPLLFSWEGLQAAATARIHLGDTIVRLATATKSNVKKTGKTSVPKTELFWNYIYTDLDMPRAMAHIWNLLKIYNQSPERYNASTFLKAILEFDVILGLNLKQYIKVVKPTKELMQLARHREELRKNKKWQEADTIRNKLLKLGWKIEDTKEGPRLKKLIEI